MEQVPQVGKEENTNQTLGEVDLHTALYQTLAKWLLIVLGIFTIPVIYLLLGLVAGASLASGTNPGSYFIIVLFLVFLLPIGLGYFLYRKKRFAISSIVSGVSLVLVLLLIYGLVAVYHRASEENYRRENTHNWGFDLTIDHILEDCGRSQSEDFTRGLQGTEFQNACYYQFAVKNRDLSLCEKINDYPLQNECSNEVRITK